MKTKLASKLVCSTSFCAWCVQDLPFVMVQYAGRDCSGSSDSKHPVTVPHYTLLCITTHSHSLNLLYLPELWTTKCCSKLFALLGRRLCTFCPSCPESILGRLPVVSDCSTSDNSYNHYLPGLCELLGVGDDWAGQVIPEVD